MNHHRGTEDMEAPPERVRGQEEFTLPLRPLSLCGGFCFTSGEFDPKSGFQWSMLMAKQDSLDPQTRDLVRFAAAIAQGYEPELRERVSHLRSSQVPAIWVEELLLQSVLMVGYPRALIAFTVWRKFSGVAAPPTDPGTEYGRAGEWAAQGAALCEVVYGENYGKLRESVRGLHPAIDAWMVTEGYGRTLSRP